MKSKIGTLYRSDEAVCGSRFDDDVLSRLDLHSEYGGDFVDFLFETVDENTPIGKLADCLKEDLIQIKYKDEYLIDVGWYPEFD